MPVEVAFDDFAKKKARAIILATIIIAFGFIARRPTSKLWKMGERIIKAHKKTYTYVLSLYT